MAPNSGYRCNPIREKQEITTIRRQLYNPVVIQPKRSKEPREARNQEKQETKRSKKPREARNHNTNCNILPRKIVNIYMDSSIRQETKKKEN